MLKPGYIDTSAASPRSLTRPGAKRTALTATAPVASPLVVTYFFHSDHLGTPKVKTNPTGAVVETWDSYPYGEQWVAGSPGDQHRFTGHLRDSESGNDYAGARYYSNNRGRWLSTDPELGDGTNPQRLNRYSYVLNDPINYVDPVGRFELPISARQQAAWDEMMDFARRALEQHRGQHGLAPPLPEVKDVLSHRISLSDIRVTEAAVSARNKLIGKLGRDPQSWKKGCLKLFSSLGIDSNEWLGKLDSLVFRDGTTSVDVIDETMFEEPMLRNILLKWTTVQQRFQEPGVMAWSPFLGNRVYLRPQDAYDPETIAHETFHKLKKDDGRIASGWGIEDEVETKGTRAISDHFSDECL